MTPSRRDCPAFEQPDGDRPGPAPATLVVEVENASGALTEELVREVIQAVLHYFREELRRPVVSAEEFARTLRQALAALGLNVEVSVEGASEPVETDLQAVLAAADGGGELAFFARLRAELRRQLREHPPWAGFCGLRGCVKQLLGARRWSARCQSQSEQIVDYLRACFSADRAAPACALRVR